MSKRIKCPYTFPHKSRKAMVEYICANGGYSAYGVGTWPLSWDMGLDRLDFSFNNLWEKAKEYADVNDAEMEEFKTFVRERVWKDEENASAILYDIAVEDARERVNDSDAHKSLGDGTYDPDVSFEFWGRGGRHLVLSKYAGVSFVRTSSADLYEVMSAWGFPSVKRFYKFVRTWTQYFTSENAKSEVEYQAAFHLVARLADDAWGGYKKDKAERESTEKAYLTVLEYLREVRGSRPSLSCPLSYLKQLAHAAGVSPSTVDAS